MTSIMGYRDELYSEFDWVMNYKSMNHAQILVEINRVIATKRFMDDRADRLGYLAIEAQIKQPHINPLDHEQTK